MGRDTVWPVAAVAPVPLREVPDAAAPPFTRAALQQLMWTDAGLMRDAAGLTRAAVILAAWRTAGAALGVEDANLLLVASHVVDAALRRTASVGAHFRSDAETGAIAAPAVGADTRVLAAVVAVEASGTDADPRDPSPARVPAAAASAPSSPSKVLAC